MASSHPKDGTRLNSPNSIKLTMFVFVWKTSIETSSFLYSTWALLWTKTSSGYFSGRLECSILIHPSHHFISGKTPNWGLPIFDQIIRIIYFVKVLLWSDLFWYMIKIEPILRVLFALLPTYHSIWTTFTLMSRKYFAKYKPKTSGFNCKANPSMSLSWFQSICI